MVYLRMSNLKKILTRILFFITFIFSQWSTDPSTPIDIGTGIQPQIAPMSDGSVYIAWLTDGNYHVYIQHIDVNGETQFDESGMLVSNHNNASWIAVFHMNLIVDSEDNAIITVLDERSGPWNVYAYKISPDGTMLWGENGIDLSSSNEVNYSPRSTVLPDNSVVVAWSPNSSNIRIQRISSDGSLMWDEGIFIEDSEESLLSPQPTVNSDGDILVQWIGQSGQVWAANSVLYLQKYDLNGIPYWAEPTIITGPVVLPMGNWSQEIIPDETSGSFSSWTNISGNVQSCLTQHIDGNGNVSWDNDLEFSTNSNSFRMSPRLALSEDSNELMAVWNQSNSSQSQRGVYAQRIDGNGNHLWGSSGIEVVSMNNIYDYLDLSTSAFEDSMITVYIQQNVNMTGDIYATKLDAEGNSIWTDDSVTITNSGMAKTDMKTARGPDCLFITWSEGGSVYAHCLRQDGTLNGPEIPSTNCIADDGTEGVELWNNCYSIENTTMIQFYNGELNDTIPSSIGNLTNLTSLRLEYSGLQGNIPSEIGNLSSLIILNLNGNQLVGAIPVEIGNLSNLTTLSLGENYFSEQIPVEIFNLVNLSGGSHGPGGFGWNPGLDLSDNLLIGEIPSGINNLENLLSLDFSNNLLNGEPLIEISNLTNLHSLNLSHNQFSGEFTQEITNLINLTGIVTGHAGATTTLPALDLSDNQFSGIIPEELCSLSVEWGGNLLGDSVFSIHQNQFCPPYPVCIENFIGVQDTSNCNISMKIKNTLDNSYFLNSAYPNPFNPITSLSYNLPKDGSVKINIYDMMGRNVRTLVDGIQTAGLKSIQWNATNDLGQTVSAGVYLYTIEAGDFTQTKKMILLK